MFRGQYGIGHRGAGLRLRPSWQWQPTSSVHDPNPPIVLEDPVAGGVTGTLSVTLAAAVVAGVAAVAVAGTGAATLAALTAVGAGGVAVAGVGAAALADLTLSGTGVVSSGGGGGQAFMLLIGD